MIGDTVVDDGETNEPNSELETVWSGTLQRQGKCFDLVPDRETKPSGFWTPPKRIYNKKSDYWTKPRTLDKADGTSDDLSSLVEDTHGE